MHLANAPHTNECRTGQEAMARARAVIARRRLSYPKPTPSISPKPVVEAKPEIPEAVETEQPLPPLLSMVVWPLWLFDIRSDRFSTQNVKRAVAKQYPIKLEKLIGRDKTDLVVKARQVAMALSWLLTKQSYVYLGREFNKDRTTVMHSVRKLRPVIEIIGPIADTASLSVIVTLAFDAYDRFMPSRGYSAGRPKAKHV